ncbi:hydroxyisourate hydrolase [Prauserella halophila]|uniref:5-hydroxyisourate hydrolase n=1 Tax=Prauserella halophila TaxID=185641 RepID=A0ABN1VXP8_9PSEU|nr:hydroxyisourate hydrolase [Prauserella halophila]MCP2234540.1 5-hydroxyisourate hydrolase [Prauserella halophila]
MSFITAHVLDSTSGTPAAGVDVELYAADGAHIAAARTDQDGRVSELGPQTLESGDYRITFRTGSYFAARGQAHFHPSVTVDFTVQPGEEHYHVPLLLSPFAYSTYRGS